MRGKKDGILRDAHILFPVLRLFFALHVHMQMLGNWFRTIYWICHVAITCACVCVCESDVVIKCIQLFYVYVTHRKLRAQEIISGSFCVYLCECCHSFVNVYLLSAYMRHIVSTFLPFIKTYHYLDILFFPPDQFKLIFGSKLFFSSSISSRCCCVPGILSWKDINSSVTKTRKNDFFFEWQ